MNKIRSIALILLALVAVAPAYAGSETKAPKKWTLSSLRNHTGKIVGAVAVAAALAAVATRAVDCGQVTKAICNGKVVNQLNRMMCAKQIANCTCPTMSWF